MRFLIVVAFFVSLSIDGISQVNRYTKPPSVAKYEPMTFNELLFAPKVKSKKYEENFQKLESLSSEWLAYCEVYEEDFDEKFENDLKDFISKINQVLEGDLSKKEFEIQKLKYGFEKIQRDFENRLKEKSKSNEVSKKPSPNSYKKLKPDAPTKVELGTLVYSMPELRIDNAKSKVIGYIERYNYELLGKYNDDFYKVKLDGKIGYIASRWVNPKWRQ